MAAWTNMMRAERLAPRTISFYKETITAVAHILAANGRPVLPRKILPCDVEFLLDYFSANDYAVQTRKGYIQALKKWCSSFDAPVIKHWPTVRYPRLGGPGLNLADVIFGTIDILHEWVFQFDYLNGDC